ncbi:MAG: hypothetical protein ACYCXN_00480 [Acidimicrobiales bacterium]
MPTVLSVESRVEVLGPGGPAALQRNDRVDGCVCGLVSYVVLKILAFQDRHEDKDA